MRKGRKENVQFLSVYSIDMILVSQNSDIEVWIKVSCCPTGEQVVQNATENQPVLP